MKVVIDIEANALDNPTEIWLIVCKDISTNQFYIFRNVTTNDAERTRFLDFALSVDEWIGHNVLGYDLCVVNNLLAIDLRTKALDTLILSKLIDYSRQGHSVENYGEEFGIEKGDFSKFTDKELYNKDSLLFKELETYCIRDVEITHKIYLKYLRYISKEERKPSIALEHSFQLITNDLRDNGFSFNKEKAEKLLSKVEGELKELDKVILKEFPPKLKMVREVYPKETKHGTLSKTDFRWVKDGDLSEFNGGPFCRCVWSDFNPSSHKQLVDVLHEAGWVPLDKTQTHIDTERELNRLKYSKSSEEGVDLRIQECHTKLDHLEKYGWKINENNLATLPDRAPSSAKSLAKRILLESRRRTLTEWLGLVNPDTGRIHGDFYGIGAWTHRMAHQHPNTANIPTDAKLFGKEMRSLWRAPKNRLLVGVDAEGIQLRIFAHYINDPEFTQALVNGKKEDKSDPHSLNQRVLGSVCASRNVAKRFIFAYLLGAGVGKLGQILGVSEDEAKGALDRLMDRYKGLAALKADNIPADAKRGWFVGLDGRAVRIPGDTPGQRKHLCMSGYLQNGEAVVMKKATVKFYPKLKEFDSKLVNLVHDEWQTETPNNLEIALQVAKIKAESLKEVGEELKLNCPLAGSYWNEDNHDYTIGTNWSQTH